MLKYTCAVFDLDGTILDTLDDLTNAVNHAMTAAGRPVHSREAVRRMVGNGVKVLIAKALGNDADEALIASALNDFRTFYAAHIDVHTREYPGVSDMLRRLRAAGIKTCVCSNKYDAAVQVLIEKHFPGLFDAVIGEGGAIPRKPDPAGALQVAARAGADAADTCFIGDSYNDYQTARNAGMAAILVSWGFADRDALVEMQPDALCDTMAQLENAVLGK